MRPPKNKHLHRGAMVSLFVGLLAFAATIKGEDPPDFTKHGLPFLKSHCLDCHSGDEPSGGMSLSRFVDSKSLTRERKLWQQVLKMVRSGSMPPEDELQPTPDEASKFMSHVADVFDYADRHAKPDPGRVTMRRLNRNEYRNTVRDLLGADFNPTEGFPADDIGHGFDNIGDVLTLSPLLMESYLDAAETIANRVIVVDPPKPPVRYLAGRFLQPNNKDTSQGPFRKMDPNSDDPTHSGPFTGPGGYLKFSADADLIFRATVYAEPGGDENSKSKSPVRVALFITGREIEPSSEQEIAGLLNSSSPRWKGIKILDTFEISARDAKAPQTIEFPINRVGGINNAGIAIVKPPDGEAPPTIYVQHLWSEGPLETRPQSHLMILACSPDKPQSEQTDEVLRRLLLRAYRRKPSDEEVARLTKFVAVQIDRGAKWEAAIQQAVQIVLCSPKFLFRAELDDRPDSDFARPIDQYQLASRMSYFLWSSMPDETLFALAAENKLAKHRDEQVQRMLADPKAEQLVENFAFQWLQIKRLEKLAPDRERFPTFNDELRNAMLMETRLFFDSVIREDRSIIDLVDADYTFLNEPLARHYGIVDTVGNQQGQKAPRQGGKPLRGESFQRVELQDRTRGGLLTQASVLAVTSNPTRTSPVKRGRWVLEQILGEPPPPPPPNVPELPTDAKAVAAGTLRERLEQHREQVSCANCHAKMDPIGFALENFNAIGAFRIEELGKPIDASGQFDDGSKFDGPAGLKDIIRRDRKLFARCLAEKMLTYAIGRGLEHYDRPTIERIVQRMEANGYKFSELAKAIVASDPFCKRRGNSEL